MNIKISIKDCDCIQGISNSKQISQVEHKKRTMLYAPPQTDKSTKARIQKTVPATRKTAIPINTQSKQYKQSQKQLLNQLKKNGNQATLNMVQTSQNILQKQNEIMEQNQKTLYQIAGRGREDAGRSQDQAIIRALEQTKNEVQKMRNQVINVAQQFNRNINEAKNRGGAQKAEIPPKISVLNSDMKNLVQASQNQIQGLENLEALKSLQNFNMQSYNQAISTLKKQIGQYLKQSENIERELKIRSAKLQKLDIPVKFEDQLYRPYQEHLQNRVKAIDLHAIRDKVYEKIGGFDYSKFQNDVDSMMVDMRGELANFNIVCKQFAITIPDIRIDQKQLKNLDMKLPSVLDEYKAAKGIKFQQPQAPQIPQAQKSTGLSRTAELQQRLKQTQTSKKPPGLPRFSTQPLDLAHQVKLTKQSQKRRTILQNEEKKEKKDLQDRIKRGGKQKQKQDEQFGKYLENRAREELELLYKQKKERLQKMQNQLYEEASNQVWIDLSLKKQDVQGKKSENPSAKKPVAVEEYEQQFEAEQQKPEDRKKEMIEQKGNRSDRMDIKEMGREILKQKLKNLLGQKNRQPHIVRPNNFIPQENVNFNGERHIQNVAEGFIAMINNTLTQVNSTLSRSIEKKIQLSQDRRPGSLEKRQPKKITIPKLQTFRTPPVFNINLAQPNPSIGRYPAAPAGPSKQQKIVVQNYQQLRIKNSKEGYNEYEISSDEEDDI